jgi:hypothetical protein
MKTAPTPLQRAWERLEVEITLTATANARASIAGIPEDQKPLSLFWLDNSRGLWKGADLATVERHSSELLFARESLARRFDAWKTTQPAIPGSGWAFADRTLNDPDKKAFLMQ